MPEAPVTEPAGVDLAPDPPVTPPAAPPTDDPNRLPDDHPVLAALKKANKEAETFRKKLAAVEEASQTETEKAINAAKAEGRAEVMSEMNKRLVATEVRAAAHGVLIDPDDAARYLDLDEFEVDAAGNVDTKSIASAVAGLATAKPHLAAGGKPQPLPGGGATPSTGSSMDDLIRRAASGKGS